MLAGDLLPDGWRSDEVREALDLCLACKGCKRDCPAGVDLAAYKAEFLHHYYQGRRRPALAYAAGLIHRWARLAALAPGLANAMAPRIKRLAGIAPERTLPAFARSTFRSRFRPRGSGPPVLLWPDTFINHFQPEIAEAAVEVLAAAGRRVEIPDRPLCCGRPLYDFGMLDRAKAYLRQVLDSLGPQIDAGVPMVVLEPSCASVFRDELRSLFPADERAGKLRAQTFLLSEFLERHAPGFTPPRLERRVLVHGHCHHKALMKMTDEESLLKKMGATVTSPDAGCCGMAGPFGFEARKFDVSMAIGERVLLPAVRNAPGDTLIVSDGFSCREQIEQTTGRKPVHLAEAIHLALNSSRST
jgi:Fe-S oxidoreductase